MSDKLHIQNEMRCLDLKNRSFYDELSDEERKKFSPFLMIRWSSTVEGSQELQEYYIQSCNHYVNKHFFAINRHPKLQWLLATAVSPALGTQRHNWIGAKKKEKGSNDVKKSLMKIYPNMKLSDIEIMSKLVSKKDLEQYHKDCGE